jgi:cation transport regulator
MPYSTNDDLPASVRRHLPQHARDIYREAFNHAWQRYGGEEATARRVAWAAVKRVYVKRDGVWVSRAGPDRSGWAT